VSLSHHCLFYLLNRVAFSFIVMASSNEYARKVLNSPAHAEPWLVSSAKQILLPQNWQVRSTAVAVLSFIFN
jgi:hypothetical protein